MIRCYRVNVFHIVCDECDNIEIAHSCWEQGRQDGKIVKNARTHRIDYRKLGRRIEEGEIIYPKEWLAGGGDRYGDGEKHFCSEECIVKHFGENPNIEKCEGCGIELNKNMYNGYCRVEDKKEITETLCRKCAVEKGY